MPSITPIQPCPRGRWNQLHTAALDGSIKRLVALLSDGSIDIDQGEPEGWTPLVIASGFGHSHAVRILLNKGANMSIVDDDGFTALHWSAQGGHLAVSKMLVEAGADLEAATSKGSTPLHLAAEDGHLEVMGVLVEAGANPDSRKLDGATPLYIAVQEGRMDAVKMLLRAKANPLLTRTGPETGLTFVPLDIAAHNGHSEVVRELVQQVGIRGCGGASGGVEALRLAAGKEHVDILAVLADAGVVDNGIALITTIGHGRELPMRFLLQQRKGDEGAYVNYRHNNDGSTPLLSAICFWDISSPSPRIVRLLVDAGADTTSAVQVKNTEGEVEFNGKPLALVSLMLRVKKIDGKDVTEEQLDRLEGIRRLLLRVEAVHAVSWLWPVDIPSMVGSAGGIGRKVAASTPLRMMLPVLRRRARRPRVLLAAPFRNAQKEP